MQPFGDDPNLLFGSEASAGLTPDLSDALSAESFFSMVSSAFGGILSPETEGGFSSLPALNERLRTHAIPVRQRSSRFRIFPVGPFGSSSTNSTIRGYL